MSVRDPNIRDYTLSKAMEFVVQERLRASIHTMIPGKVEAYDPATKRARILPALYRVYTDRPMQARAILLDVPVITPSTGGVMVFHPIKVGDMMAVLFSERGLEEFKKRWDVSEPTPGHYFEDAVATPWGIETISPVDTEAFCIQSADGNTYIKLKDGLIEMKCGAQTFRMTPQRGDLV